MEKVPRRFAIPHANRYMVDHSDYLIAYAWHPASNARNLVDYAMRKNKAVINIAESEMHHIIRNLYTHAKVR
jgi:hypothetical protein